MLICVKLVWFLDLKDRSKYMHLNDLKILYLRLTGLIEKLNRINKKNGMEPYFLVGHGVDW